MIEPTDEMVAAVDQALTEAAGTGTGEARAAARAVLALVERDYVLERRCIHGSNPRRCGPCSFDRAIPRATSPR